MIDHLLFPGVLMAIKGVPNLTGVDVGLETLMDV
ncbi:MAG: hypothetical protein Ct9H90mP11_05620 [Acidimicrobiales bacterium]|nr:MAG: hypothetical protein Ct9H90mP11_05620 [Acidimicrobiales bacterium]